MVLIFYSFPNQISSYASDAQTHKFHITEIFSFMYTTARQTPLAEGGQEYAPV